MAGEQLGIECAASGEELRSAYLRQARLHHPDANTQDDQAANLFKDDNTAYRLLRQCYAIQHRALAPDVPEEQFRCDFAQAAAGGLLCATISRSSDLAARN